MLRIALDATYSVGKQISGVGVYSRELMSALVALGEPVRWLWCYRPHRFLRSSFSGVSRRVFGDSWVPGCDVFHGLNQRLPTAKLRRSVVTFHDLFVMTGDYSTPEFRARFTEQARMAAERADVVIAISEFTAAQVEALLGVERSRIRVVHHGVHLPALVSGVAREKVILNVGAIQRRKNIVRLVEAFERTPVGWKLVLAGSAGFDAAEAMARIEQSSRRADIEVTGYVSEERLEALYASASVFAFPSLDEGFGMPILEAMARGVPVVTSNRSAMPEVAGDAAVLVDPEDTEAIAEGLNSVIANPADWAARGRTRAAEFSWEKAAKATFDVYLNVAR